MLKDIQLAFTKKVRLMCGLEAHINKSIFEKVLFSIPNKLFPKIGLLLCVLRAHIRKILAKKPLQLSGIVGLITKLPTCFIKNPTLPFKSLSDHHARTDNSIFNKTETLLK